MMDLILIGKQTEKVGMMATVRKVIDCHITELDGRSKRWDINECGARRESEASNEGETLKNPE
jgi:hypothetical protein